MKKSLFLVLVTLLTGCASFQVSTLNHDPIYVVEGSDAEVTVIDNEFELQRLLRTDFNFRYDFAQYALRQPRSFDWNSRILGNRYSFYSPYYSRSEMWNDWVWGYNGWNSWGQPHRWSPFGYDRWGYGIHYGWNNHGWGYNRYRNNGWNNYGWSNLYGYRGRVNYHPNYNRYRGTNVTYHSGRRSGVVSTNGRAHAAMIQSTKEVKVKNRKVKNNNNDKITRLNPRRNTTTQSNSNGGRSRSRQIIPNQTIRSNRTPNVQPRQVRRRPSTPVSQQPRSSRRPSKQGR
jgi:hypothetical protein